MRAVTPTGESRSTARGRRAASALAAALLALSLTACDQLPGLPGSGSGTTEPAPRGEPMDPEQVAAASMSPVDPSWLCRPGESGDPPPSAEDAQEGGEMVPESVRTEGNDVLISGPFRLEDGYTYTGFTPSALVLPAATENRGRPSAEYDVELGVEGAPVPPMVVRERVEVPGDGPAPSAVAARLRLGTCDDAPLPDGQYLLRLGGGEVEGAGRAEDEVGWSASEDVLVDVVDGALEPVPGAVSAPTGEIPADLSPLACGAELSAVGDGDGLAVTVADPPSSVSTEVAEGAPGGGVTAEVTVTSEDLGTRALLPGIVITDPRTGTIVAGARNAPRIALQWIGEEGLRRAETAWTTQEACGGSALSPGEYRAHALAVTVDEEGATHLVLSDPWDVEVVEEDPAS